MSLTSFIAMPEVKARFKEEFTFPKITLPTLACCEPRTKNYTLIGTAFDYLLRFRLQYAYPHAVVKAWVAGYAAREAKSIIEIGFGLDFDRPDFDLNMAKKVQQAWTEAEKNHAQYLASGVMTEALLRSSLYLAQMDWFFRAGELPPTFGQFDEEDVSDLKALFDLIPLHLLPSQTVCLLNPVFGASSLVGGADVDLVIDNMLIDFKTTKYMKITRDYINQLLGYYTLHTIKGIVGAPDKHEIDTIGIYFCRHGYLHTWPISDFINPKTFPEFQKWFKATAKRAFK